MKKKVILNFHSTCRNIQKKKSEEENTWKRNAQVFFFFYRADKTFCMLYEVKKKIINVQGKNNSKDNGLEFMQLSNIMQIVY